MQQQWRRHAGDWMNYGEPQGLEALRGAISSYLVQSRGVVCEPDQILILTSSQQGILLATQLLIDAGDTVWVEDPGYPGARTAMESAGARVHPVPVDEEGSTRRGTPGTAAHLHHARPPVSARRAHEPAAADGAAGRGRAARRLDPGRRLRRRVPVRSAALPALQGLDGQGRVLYVGTFSRCCSARCASPTWCCPGR